MASASPASLNGGVFALGPEVQTLSVFSIEVLVWAILLHHENLGPQAQEPVELFPVEFRPMPAMPDDVFGCCGFHVGKLAPLPRYFCGMAGGNVLSVEGLTKRFGERLIFEDLHFGLDLGQKAALVAGTAPAKAP